jgi:hypothetical protein
MSAVLTLLRIRNFAFVEELEWQIGLALVAVTGETERREINHNWRAATFTG